MAQFKKHFSLAEANSLIPRLQRVFLVVHRLLRGEPLPGQELDSLQCPAFSADKRRPGPELSSMTPRDRQRVARQLLEEELHARGIVIQDIWRGLIDFPHLLSNGSEILLCYELSDGDAIVAFHDLYSGFIGRRPIRELGD